MGFMAVRRSKSSRVLKTSRGFEKVKTIDVEEVVFGRKFVDNVEGANANIKGQYVNFLYDTLYKVLVGEEIKEPTKLSIMMERSINHALEATHTVEINNLLKLLFSFCPSRIYENTNSFVQSENKEFDISKYLSNEKKDENPAN